MNEPPERRGVSVGLLFRLEAKPGTEREVSQALEGDLAADLQELSLSAWHTIRFDALRFGVIAAFTGAAGESEHVGDRVATALREHTEALLEEPITVESFDVLAQGASATREARTGIPQR